VYVIQLIATMLLGNEHGIIELRERTTILRYAYIACLFYFPYYQLPYSRVFHLVCHLEL